MSSDADYEVDFAQLRTPSRPTTASAQPAENAEFLEQNLDWKLARERVNENLNDISCWDALITLTEGLLVKYPQMDDSIKLIITSTFEELLGSFPLLFGYWKKYTSVQYQINGIDESVSVLSRALDVFPTSVDLWVDYLNILVSNFGAEKDKIRLNMEIASSYIGNQFLSHVFWDKFIEFEKSENSDLGSLVLLRIYLKIIRIPLHQYARYYQEFLALLPEFRVDDILHNEELEIALDPNDSEENKRIAIQQHFNAVFAQTQQYVTEIWEYESKIQVSYFNLVNLPKEEIVNWDNYLNYQIDKFSKSPDSKLLKQQTISVFERCLIPTALLTKFWFKYLNWYLDSFPTSFNEINAVYKKAVNLFVPVNYTGIRLNYVLFLEKHKREFDEVSNVYLSIIQFLPYELKPVSRFVKYLARYFSDIDRLLETLNGLLAKYLDNTADDITDDTMRRFLSLLNDKTVSVIVVEIIKINWYLKKDVKKVYELLNSYSKQSILNDSIGFWSLSYKFFKSVKDFDKLAKCIDFIKLNSALPPAILNTILMDYADFLQTNISTNIYETDNFNQVLNLECNVNNIMDYRIHKDAPLLKSMRKQSGHPGIFVTKPTITNSIVYVRTNRSANCAQNLPTFRNVEKAALPVEYPEEEGNE